MSFLSKRSVIPTQRVSRSDERLRERQGTARTGTRSGRMGRVRRGLRADSVNEILISQDQGGRDKIYCRGGRNTTLKSIVSMEGESKGI